MKYKLTNLCLISFCTFLLTTSQPSAAADLVVDDDGEQCPRADYTNLQDAVDAAQPGETLAVCPGLYAGTITIGADKAGLTLRGRSGRVRDRVGDPAREAVVAGSPEGTPGFAVQADDVAIIGFTIYETGDTGIEVKWIDGATPISGAWLARLGWQSGPRKPHAGQWRAG